MGVLGFFNCFFSWMKILLWIRERMDSPNLWNVFVLIYSLQSSIFLTSWNHGYVLCSWDFCFFFPSTPKISQVKFWWCEHMLAIRKVWYKLLVSLESGSSFFYLTKLVLFWQPAMACSGLCQENWEIHPLLKVLGMWKS